MRTYRYVSVNIRNIDNGLVVSLNKDISDGAEVTQENQELYVASVEEANKLIAEFLTV